MNFNDERVPTNPGDELVEQIWQELRGNVSRTQLRQLVNEAASEFSHATITTYVPIFVRRRVREKLLNGLGN